MSEEGVSSGNKKILFIGLFIVPFLAGMVLIFYSKGIGTLPIMKCDGKFASLSYKDTSTCLYTIPEFEYFTLKKESKIFDGYDSSIYVVNFYPQAKREHLEFALQSNRKILERYSNCKVLSLIESDDLNHLWTQNPDEFFKKFPNWVPAYQTSEEFNRTMSLLKVEVSDSTGYPPFVIVDKERHIRARCKINDIKEARDIPKMLKLLNNQYAPRKNTVERKTDNY